MAKERKGKKKVRTEDNAIEKTIDPYTGELKPVPEDADKFVEVVPEETNDRSGSNYLLNEETSLDNYAADSDADAVAEEAAHYTEDKDIEEDFAERQDLAASGREELQEELNEHHSLSPDSSGGDIDASWQTAAAAGEETPGGTVPTPDQDIVDNLGAAAGLRYDDDEPLNADKKILDRDRHRWELNPDSTDDEENEDEEEGPEDLYEDLEEEESEEDDEDLEDEEERVDDEVEDEEEDEDLDELGYQIEDDEDEE